MNGYESELKRILGQHGWKKVRQGKGSHEIWGKDGMAPITIPYGCKSRHLANKILRHCEIDHRFQ